MPFSPRALAATLAIALALLPASPLHAGTLDTQPRTAVANDRRPNADELTIMAFNAEFLWDGEAPEDGEIEFDHKGRPSLAREHMGRIAEVIRRNNPDMVLLTEIEHQRALETLNDRFLQGMGYRAYASQGRDTYTGQDVGLLTRVDPELDRVTYDDRPGRSSETEKSVSKNLSARFRVNDTPIAIVGLHFLANPTNGRRLHDRQAQADAIRQIASEHRKAGYIVLVLGDFNDYEDAADARDHRFSTPITRVMSIVRELDPNDPTDDLFNAARHIPQDKRYTAFWDANEDGRIDTLRELSSIDHILLDPDLQNRVNRAWIDHTHDPRVVSDHYPVLVTLDMRGGLVPLRDLLPREPDGNPIPPTGTPGDPRGPADPQQDPMLPEGPAAPASITIRSILANPAGSENQNESITFVNTGQSPVDLTGWTVRDITGRTWKLDAGGVVQPGQAVEVKRAGQRMALNNSGDTVDLINPQGGVVLRVSYRSAPEGVQVTPTVEPLDP